MTIEHKDLTADILGGYQDYDNHYKVRFFTDQKTGLKACIAVHNINLGPALGGCRMYRYAGEEEAIRDVLRLSRGMTYKNALANLPLGGGKSVIIGDPRKDKTEALIELMGSAVDTLGGAYISAEDSGTNMDDMAVMKRRTRHVMGLRAEEGKLGGDPSPVTAFGVFCGMKAALQHQYGSDAMDGLKVAVQGLGAVGYELCRLLDEQGAELFVTDVREEVLEKAQKQFAKVHITAPDDIFGVEAQVFAPCALGAQLNEHTIAQMKFDIIAGAANNQLETVEDSERLADKDILYAPDYALNAGGVIAVGYEYFEGAGQNPFSHALTRENMMKHVGKVRDTVAEIFKVADKCGITPARAADEMAEAIFNGDAAKKRNSGAG